MSTLFTLNTSIMPIGTIVFTYLFQKDINGGLIFIFGGVSLLIYTVIMLPRIYRILQKNTFIDIETKAVLKRKTKKTRIKHLVFFQNINGLIYFGFYL